MGASYSPRPYAEYKYCRIPKRRLISGFLTVNVVNSNSNADRDDFNDWVFTNWTNLADDVQAAKPFGDADQALADSVFTDDPSANPNRTGKKLSFGDYDCFLFWVVGGVSQHAPVLTGKITDFTGYTGSPTDTTADEWWTTIVDPCQSFLKYHLVSRINNGYGYREQGWTNYWGSVAQTRVSFLSSSGSNTSHVTPAQADTAAALSGEIEHLEAGKHVECLQSNGIYSANNLGAIDLDDIGNNSFFPPVEFIDIFALHHANKVTQVHDTLDDIYSMSAGGGYHDSSFWDLVVKVNLRGFDSGWDTDDDAIENADRVWFETNTNIFFQPFGETGNFEFDDTQHTS